VCLPAHPALPAYPALPALPRLQMMNKISESGAEIAMGRDENLHTSGHAYK
jgi:mRNA degradation ribonuclease J1/J2